LLAVTSLAIRRHRSAERWRADQAAAESDRRREIARADLAQKRTLAEWQASWARLRTAPQGHYELLEALAKATPPAIALEELRCDGETIRLRGRIAETTGPANNALAPFCRELGRPDAPWRFPGVPEVGAGEFTWQGSFQTTPGPAAAGAITAARWKDLAAHALAELPTRDTFDAMVAGWNRQWTLLAQSAKPGSDPEVRHYALAYRRPALSAWSGIVQTIRQLCATPGVTVDSLVLAAAPDQADAFAQAQVSLTARVRRSGTAD
jgi:hypothetical protein